MADELEEIRNSINAVDREMAGLFERRMKEAAKVARYKQARGLPIWDAKREQAVIGNNAHRVSDAVRPYYVEFLKEVMRQTRNYEGELMETVTAKDTKEETEKTVAGGIVMEVALKEESYPIILERGALQRLGCHLSLNRKILVVSDDGVPEMYWKRVLEQCPHGYAFIFPQGEESKNIHTLTEMLSVLAGHGFTRSDAVIAVGGGVTGDMAGFASACYMRGIDFYNLPTTLLSQVDSSVGGKTAIDFEGVKNLLGAFHQPKKVIVDTETLRTLPPRIFHEGLAEALKMAVTFSRPLFDFIRDAEVNVQDGNTCAGIRDEDIDTIVAEALRLKKKVVEADPSEKGLRRVLNFGHTVGHAIEAAAGGALYHGECVGMGMLYCCSESVGAELVPVLQKFGLPVSCPIPAATLLPYIGHDKKKAGDGITIVWVNDIGSFELRQEDMTSIAKMIETNSGQK